ncbi:hypothetical protein RCL_jg21967.t1 [Rhizophagus clarus]|uniref:Uncharacterized protein n=1 Tax=Rhizophagus clarus TaxID=94130 RepID=A0A8H3MAL7_9GLOM|nr:hypothetical protein RCL_jg21967.t1 [Rhizophagus clarus]
MLYKLAPANSSDLDLANRKKFLGEFIGFDNNISPAAVQEAYVAQNPKHAHRITTKSIEHISSPPSTTKSKPRCLTINPKNRSNKSLISRQEVRMKSIATGANASELERLNRIEKSITSTRPLDPSLTPTDNTNPQGPSTSSIHIDGIVKGQILLDLAYSSNIMISLNQILILDFIDCIDNSHINNNIIDDYVEDKDQIGQNINSPFKRIYPNDHYNRCEKDVFIFLSRQRLAYESGYEQTNQDYPHHQLENN